MVLCKLCVISLQGIYLADNVAYSDGAYHHTYLEEDSPPQRLMLIASALTGEVGVEWSALSRALVLVVIFRQKILESKSIQRRAEYARNPEQGTTVYGLVLSIIQSWDPVVEFRSLALEGVRVGQLCTAFPLMSKSTCATSLRTPSLETAL